MSAQDTVASPAAAVEQSGTLDTNHSSVSRDSSSRASSDGPSSSTEAHEPREDEQALESHEVIELQAFSERKVWIEDKIKFLETLPPIEVFVGLDAVRASAEVVPGLPTRTQLQEWLVEHDRIEKETEIFDSGELKKLKKFTKAAAQRNLSPADTDLIELTLTTIYELDKLLHLLRDRSDNLDLLGIRLTWEERRVASWVELRKIVADLQDFLVTRARWSPAIYDEIRRNSVVSIASVASDSSLSLPGFSRGARFKLSELLSRDAAQFASRTSSLRHTRVAGAGKVLDKLIDSSRRPVPEELLDEQDRLENKGINEMEDVGKFVMSVVMQWKKADEIYVETLKDKTAAQTLMEELEMAMLNHPTSRQDAAFLSRSNALIKRLFMRTNPASSNGAFPNPTHHLYPDQHASNDAITRLLSSELSSAIEQAKKVESCAKDYHASLEAVRRVESACKAASDLSSQLTSLIEPCLDSSRHSVFLAMLPTILQELQKADEDVGLLLPSARAALLHLDRPGVDPQFKADSASEIERMETLRGDASRAREQVIARASTLSEVRQIWSEMGQAFEELEDIRGDIVDAIERDMWRQHVRPHDAPPTPESPVTSLPATPRTGSPEATMTRLEHAEARLEQQVLSPLSAVSPSVGPALKDCMCTMVRYWESAQKQAVAMAGVQDEVHGLQIQLEELKVRFDKGIQDVLADTLSGANLQQVEGDLDGELKRCQDSVQTFTDTLSRRVPFVGHVHITGGVNVVATKKRFSMSGSFSLDRVQHAAQPDFPFDPAALDRAVRADANSYSMMLSGGVKSLEQKADHFRLAKVAKAIDVAVSSVLDNIHSVVEVVSSIQSSIGDTADLSTSEHLQRLSSQVDTLAQTEGTTIARSFSPSEPGVREDIVISRQKAVDDAEAQYSAWRESVATLQQQITVALQAEEARLAEEIRLKEERERLEAEERARIERERIEVALHEEAERKAQAERERLDAEARERAERERLDRESRERAERDRWKKKESEFAVKQKRINFVLLCRKHLSARACTGRGFEWPADVFGLRLSSSKGTRSGSQQLSDLQIRVFSLRKRLRSIHINDVARPGSRSDIALPEDGLRKRMEKELSAVVVEVDRLPASVPDDPSVDTELRSLRNEVTASIELMQRVHKLTDLGLALHHCDECLSDLLEHIDSFPSPPIGVLSTSHASDTSLTPEDQLSARLGFTKGAIDTMVSLCSTVADDPRADPERERIIQTWSELEAMGLDRVNGQKSRPPSVISSASSSKTSASKRPSVVGKKTESYSRLSIGSPAGSPQPRFLAPPQSARRSVSGSSTGHTRSSSRLSSVSGPLSSSSTLYGSTFASRQRTTSVSSNVMTPVKRGPMATARPRAQTGKREQTASPTLSEASSFSLSRSGVDASRSSTGSRSVSFPMPRSSPPRVRQVPVVRKPYLDVALPVNINIELVPGTWKDQNQDPKLCFCRILRSQTVMVRLSKFIKEHFADAFRLLPESPPHFGSPSRLGSREEQWISSATLSQAAEMIASPTPPRTPEPNLPFIPSFALSTPSGKSPQSLKSTPSPGSPLTAMQFFRRVDRESPSVRPETPSRSSHPGISPVLNSSARQPAWRP
ncbi:hypothetical protein B0H21DRAFT_755749 [Amylocystis lapponica]|nr:hypothetical protein B0H21DRAFT_755749 [Amylocystis lapponica]